MNLTWTAMYVSLTLSQSDFYAALRPYSKDSGSLQVVFNTQDEELHKRIKNPIAPLFSLTAATSFEPLVDGVLQFMDEKLRERFAQSGQVFNLGDYCQFYAFDVMGTMTFSKRHGFLDQGKDVNNMIGALHKFMETVGPVSRDISHYTLCPMHYSLEMEVWLTRLSYPHVDDSSASDRQDLIQKSIRRLHQTWPWLETAAISG